MKIKSNAKNKKKLIAKDEDLKNDDEDIIIEHKEIVNERENNELIINHDK